MSLSKVDEEREIVGLFSSYANELRRAHRHLHRDAPPESRTSKAAPSRKPQPRISEDQEARVVAGYEAGKPVYDLAQAFGCHRVTISAVLKRRGVALHRASPSDEQVDEMIRLYESGLSLAKVGAQFDVQASTVLSRLRARGVATRSR